MSNWKNIKERLEEKYNIEIYDSDEGIYKRTRVKGMSGAIFGTLFATGIIMFIVIGILLNKLSFDTTTILPLGIVLILFFSSVNDVQKKAILKEQKFIEAVKKARASNEVNKAGVSEGGSNIFDKVTPSPSPRAQQEKNVASTKFKKPIPAVECPICKQLIPMGSNPCPKCGAKLIWE
ncbi:MAG: hypothetical protein ACTSU2_03795 [Promethearchaeota archaeon]